MPETDELERRVSQSNTTDCDNCGADGDLGNGYGGMSAVECPKCGDEWVVE